VEAALVMPVIMIIIFGMLEAGLFFKDALSLSDVVRDAARAGASHGDATDADYWILQTLEEETGAIPAAKIEEVIVYNAAALTTPPNPSVQSVAQTPCYTPPGAVQETTAEVTQPTAASANSTYTQGIDDCNIYTSADFGEYSDATWLSLTAANCATTIPDACGWPAWDRDNTREDLRADTTTAAATCETDGPGTAGCDFGPDLLGLYVKISHTWYTGIISTSPTTITDSVILTIEPQQ
jgi:hypothetical protein